MLKFALIYAVCSQGNPLVMFGFAAADSPIPPWLDSMKNNKIYSCLMIFFMTNAIESTLTSTGAFEVYANDKLMYSKIQTGQVPQPNIIVGQLDEMFGKTPGSDAFKAEF